MNGSDESSEDTEAKSFWDAFFNVFWKGILSLEHKSGGKDLDRAFKQATDYFPGLKERDLPRYVLPATSPASGCTTWAAASPC